MDAIHDLVRPLRSYRSPLACPLANSSLAHPPSTHPEYKRASVPGTQTLPELFKQFLPSIPIVGCTYVPAATRTLAGCELIKHKSAWLLLSTVDSNQ